MKADFGDVRILANKDVDVQTLITLLKMLLRKYGMRYTMRVVACVLAPYKRQRFEGELQVREYQGQKSSRIPSTLTGKSAAELDVDLDRQARRVLDHKILWQQKGKLMYLTAEPYDANKNELRGLIEYCDTYDIDFQIDAYSIYYPGRTICIFFKKASITQILRRIYRVVAGTLV